MLHTPYGVYKRYVIYHIRQKVLIPYVAYNILQDVNNKRSFVNVKCYKMDLFGMWEDNLLPECRPRNQRSDLYTVQESNFGRNTNRTEQGGDCIMYVTTKCACCGETSCHDLTFELQHREQNGEKPVSVHDVETLEVCTLDELVEGIVEQLEGHKISSHAELENVLREIFRVSPRGCPEVVEQVSDCIGVMN
jgi:hypothetical protein